MAKEVIIDIDETTGDCSVEAKGYQMVNGKCQGVEATKFLENDLGGFETTEPVVQDGRDIRQNHGNRTGNRATQR